MCAYYDEVLVRLKEERKRLSWTQDDISTYMHINQGNYCKIENGKRRFSYNEVKELYKSEMDVNYIFSGQRVNHYYRGLLGDCSYREAMALFNVMASVITYYWEAERTDFWKGMYQRVRFMHLIDIDCIDQQNIFLLVRQDLKYLQPQMAELLEVDIKKLRDLEKGKSMPDSELLWFMYDRFYIPPAVILKSKKGLLGEMSCLMERVVSVREQAFIDVIKIFQNR